jgi:ATP-dependent protease ClpP protease subunit
VDLPQAEIQSLFAHGIDFYDRRIYLTGDINQESASNVIRSIYILSRVPESIEVMIQSYGGDLSAAFAIYDAIQSISCIASPIHTVGIGEVDSAALLILSCGFTRSATTNVYAMAHTSTSDLPEGEVHSVLSGASAMADANNMMWSLLAKHTNLTASEWSSEAKEGGEIWMRANDLKRRGVIDDIIPPNKMPRRIKPVSTPAKKAAKKK